MPPEGKRPREEPHPNERPVAPHPPEDNTDEDDFICDECKAVDWSSLPDLAANGLLKRDPNLSQPLRTVNATAEQLNSSPCKVCRILSIIVPGCSDEGQHHLLQATPISTIVKGYHSYLPDLECTALGVYCCNDGTSGTHSSCKRSRYLAIMNTRGDTHRYTARKMPSSIDFNELHTLIDHCHKEHKRCCKVGSSDNISGLQVIDVSKRTVIQAPSRCNYLALSYVWGKCDDDGSANSLMAPPPVIEDAIQLAISMEQRYLWVDRCVSCCRESFPPLALSHLDKQNKPV